MDTGAATLLGQPGPQRGSTAAAAVGSAAVFTSGAAPGSAAGSAAGSSERISMLRRNSGFENFPNRWGIAQLSDVRNHQLERSTCCHMTFYEKEGAHALCQHVTLCNCGGLPALTTTVKNANHTVGRPRSMLKTCPPWLHRHGTPPWTGNGIPNVSAELLQPQKQLFITGEVLSEAGRSQRKGFLHPADRMCSPMLRPMYTQSRPLRQVSEPHLCWATGVA